ncbi:MAG: hypothetical protein A4E45_01324 [Methanosaeta sp. PtaB.Bin039]|nr:MAG: hypothetical protein A4E45_01324 [Methanosaeta sp. PtaB.Bin039]OPY44611.1 MAG: hypothetical protein A4E47_01463 [Methanosaeta sp. PtaU1.Bin028]
MTAAALGLGFLTRSSTLTGMTEINSRCESCKIRKYTEKHPYSVVASLWRWHTGWCPGWKSYQRALAEQKAAQVRMQGKNSQKQNRKEGKKGKRPS